jgi:RimJ/RimL family protein N-acetyltransferase
MKLIGEKVTLRPIKLSDAKRFVAWLSDPAVNHFLSRRKINLKEEYVWIRSLPKKKNEVHFAIDTREGVHIGTISLHVNKQDSFALFGIAIGDKNYWSQGYGTEAMKLIVDYGFRRLKLHRIELEVYDYNVRGIKLYKRLGFKLEGKKRERVKWGKKYYNALQMGILRREWLKK